MKIKVIMASFAALTLLAAGYAKSDEQADLKQKISELEQTVGALDEKVKDLEGKQEKQTKTITKMKKAPSAAEVVSDAFSKKVNIGGHFKFFMADYSDGKRNDVDQHNNLSAGVNELWLFFRKPINDWLNLDVAPSIRVSAGATPSLGEDISRSSSASVDVDLDEAYMTVRLPQNFEMRVGAFYPYFSDNYAGRVWWHEMYHGSNGLITLENWQSSGIEIYRNFDFENFSLPVYFYPYLNGLNRGRTNDSRFTDNNGHKNILLHIAPEAFLSGARFRILGSFGWGRWDDDGKKDAWQYTAGADVTYGSFKVSGEYLMKKREEWEIASNIMADADDKGWYASVFYTLTSEWRFLVKYSDVDLFYPSTDRMLTDNYKALELAVNYWISDGSTIIPQIEYVDSERSDNSEKLKYIRYILGWRTTF